MRKKSVLMALILPLLLASTLSLGFNPVCGAENLTMIRTLSDTSVGGRIVANTTWTVADSPYTLVDDVVVEIDVFLTIEPGVIVKFTNETNLIIDGALVAQGNSTHPITFTSNASMPQPGDWGTIRFRDTSMDEACIIDWAVIEYASAGITIYKSSLKIGDSTMRYNVDAFYSESDGIARIYNCTILNNTYGVRGDFRYFYDPPYDRSEISYSFILNNTYGVQLWDGDLTIRKSIVSNNTYGVRSSGYGYKMIQESTISNNTYGIWSEYGTLRILGSNISYNNHGVTANSATISKSIISENNGKGISPTWWYDYYDNKTYYYSGTFSIRYSTIIGNEENGITSKGNTIVHFSNVYGNTPYDVYNAAPFEWTYGDVDATNNWLGTTNTTEIDEHIYDYYDDYDLKKVFYQPFLDSEVTIPPIAHDVAITNVTISPTVVERWQYVYVTVNIVNEGDFDENVTVTTRYDSVQIGNWTYMYGLLSAGANTTASFEWYIESVPLGNYTISAEVNIVPGETDTADNVFVDGQVEVTGPPPEPPYASFEYSPYYPSVGEPITFDAGISSYDPDGYIVSYVWNYGDGTTGSGDVTTHVYNDSGTYSVTLTATDNDGLNATSIQDVTVASLYHDVAIAWVSVSPTIVIPGETVMIDLEVYNQGDFEETFDVTVYYDSTTIETQMVSLTPKDGWVLSFGWETVGVPEGAYTIVAEATPVAGETDTADNTYIFGDVYIEAEIVVHDIAVLPVEVYPTYVYIGETVFIYFEVMNQGSEPETFDVYVYADANATIIGDEIIITIFTDVFIETWEATVFFDTSWDTTAVLPGYYTISAEVPPVPDEVDTADNIFVTGIVTIALPPPTASFIWEPETPYVGDPAIFDASASYDPDGTIVGYYWDFGDGTTSNTTETGIEHAYNQTNTYSVTLTVVDNDGLTNSATIDITVVHRVLSVKLTGDFDYMRMEPVSIRLAALVREAETMEPVSDAVVNVEIYDSAGNLWVSVPMLEKILDSGIYEWASERTIGQLRLSKGVYLVRASASFRSGPTAYDILEFHIDPPAEGASEMPYYIAITAVTLLGLTGLILRRRQISNRLRQLNRRN